jgi:nitrate reductase gamma subunit
VPSFILGLEYADTFLQIGVPALYLSGATLVVGVTLLLLRRFAVAQVRYISQPADYFPCS